MWRGLVLFGALALLLTSGALCDESADPPARTLKLQKYLRLHVTGGRIEVHERSVGQSRTVTTGEPESPYRQHLQLQVRPPCLVVKYEAVDPDGQLTLRLCERRKMVIERSRGDAAGAETVRYEQPLLGPVTLTVTGDPSRSCSAPSLWHLLLAHGEECREHLLPMLERLSPDWQLDRQVEEIREALLSAAGDSNVAVLEKEWQRLAGDLASDSFRRRQAADAALRSGGQSAAAFLERLDSSLLTAEQRRRIERIRQAQADGSTDSPQRVAARLMGDRSVWLKMLELESSQERMVAANHLRQLVGRDIAFDPLADERTRQSQCAALAKRIRVP